MKNKYQSSRWTSICNVLNFKNIVTKYMLLSVRDGNECKEMAEALGLTPREIRFQDNRTLNPFDAALACIAI